MDGSKVTVKIFNQEYTIAGQKTKEQIVRIAEYVDEKMHEISKGMLSAPTTALATLSAVNVADEYFDALDKILELKAKNQELQEVSDNFEKLWSEAKQNFSEHREDLKETIAKHENTERLLLEKEDEVSTIKEEKETEIKRLKAELQEVTGKIKETSKDMVKELEDKYKDLESSFFDIQMENIQLKGELERLKK